MPSQFTGPLRVEHLDADWRDWKLLEPLRWEWEEEGSGHFIEVPAGYVTDGASVPRFLWWLYPSTGAYMRAAALHDWLCDLLKQGTPDPLVLTRAQADRQFRLAMAACGINLISRTLLYLGVRIGAALGM